MALRDNVKKSKEGSGLRKAVKSKPKSTGTTTAKPAETASQPAPPVSKPIPIVPEPFDYIRALARIPGLRKGGVQR